MAIYYSNWTMEEKDYMDFLRAPSWQWYQLAQSTSMAPYWRSHWLEHLVLSWGCSNLKDGHLMLLEDESKQPKPEERLAEGEEDLDWVVEEGDDKYIYCWDWVISNGDWGWFYQLASINFYVAGFHHEESVTKLIWETRTSEWNKIYRWPAPIRLPWTSPHSDGFFLPTPENLYLLAFSSPRCIFSSHLGPNAIARVLLYLACKQKVKGVGA